MESLSEGATPIRNVRIPDKLWERLESWAQESGVGDAAALRELLRIGLETEPFPPLRPLQAWMRRHETGLVFARVTPGRDWWDLDSALGQMRGAKLADGRTTQRWWLLPATELESLRGVFTGRSDRLRVHG